ncbi:MAG TPA: serine hydrolase domain-containing protein [Chitinophagaceae bacterium]|nr:serine hydrolase domain-containing protein [Chitinophagaceae bacterium]
MNKFLRFLRNTMFILLLVFPLLLSAQVIQTSGTNNFVNYEKLAKIDGLINDYVKKDWVKGVVTIVVKDNQVVQYKGYGFADAETKKPMEKDELFRIASQTKAITAVGIMILYEQGKLLLDERIADFIPEFKDPVVIDKFSPADSGYSTVPAKRDITIRDLLTHTSGIDYSGIGSENMRAIYAKAGISGGFNTAKKNQLLLDAMKLLAKLPLAHQPGEKWTYGLNFDLLGCLIELISGMNLNDFFTHNIFEPMGMKDTYFNVPANKGNRIASVYTEDSLHHVIKWDKEQIKLDPGYPLVKKQYFSGGADLTSTAFDYAAFLQMLLNGGTYNGHQILSPRTIEIMVSNQLDFKFNGVNDFGLSFEVVSDKGAAKGPRNKGSFAWGGFWGTTYWADPKAHLVCLIMTQQTPNSHSDLAGKFEAMVYASLK